jgi:hypothetical protein
MKKILLCLAVFILFAGCAASTYKTARGNANQVTNGMTVKEASSILGMEPTHLTAEKAQWQRGNAREYNATIAGAVEFKLSRGVIVGVPPGGIFGEEARRVYIEERNAIYAQREAELAVAASAKEAEVLKQKKRRDAEDEKNAKQRLANLEAEARAAEKATVICNDKATCAKIFALSQIYAAQNVDQKIQVVTDTIIQTYNPTEAGKMGASITKAPRRGTTEAITVIPSCNEGEHSAAVDLCILRRTRFYDNFRPFIEASLNK